MLTIKLSAIDDFKAVELQLEHSLVSLSKWESIHEKAFFSRDLHTHDETESYIKQMVISSNSPESFIERLSSKDYKAINEYINSKQTATWFSENNQPGGSQETVTSELIYYWMINFQIPFSCDVWHLNRLMTLIKICSVKQTKPKRMSRVAQQEQYRRLNEERRRKLGTEG